MFRSTQGPDLDGGGRSRAPRPRLLFAGIVAGLVACLVFVAWGRDSGGVDLVAGEPYPTGGCHLNADYSATCTDPATGNTWTSPAPGDPNNLSIGYAPTPGTIPGSYVVGGVQTATRTAAGAAAASSACRTGVCFYLTAIASAAIAKLGFDFTADRQADNMAQFNPQPDPGAPPVIQYPCSHMSITFTPGASTISSVQVVTQAYQVGAPNSQALNSELCNSSAVYTIYAKDGAGLMHRCSTTWSENVYYGPTYGYAAKTKTGLASATCTGTWIMQGLVATPQPSGATNNVGEGYGDGVITKGTFNPGETTYRTEKRCEYSGGGYDLQTREDIGRIVFKACQPPQGQTGAGTLATVYARVVVEDGWRMVDQYDLGAPPDPANTTAYPQCYVASGSSVTNVCTMQVKVDGQPCYVGMSQACYEWTQTRLDTPSRVECWMGPYVMPADACNWMEGWYHGDVYPMTGPNVDGNPATWDGTKPSWQLAPIPTASPSPTATATVSQSPSPTSTVQPQPDPSSQTATQTQTQTQTATQTQSSTASATVDPGTGTGSTPGASGQPAPDDAAGQECFPSGWGVFNPAEWVLKPVKCALWWAWVPPDMGERMQDWWDVNKGRFDGSTPGKWWAVLPVWEGAFQAGGGGGGCQGPAVSTGFLGARGYMPATIYPFEACSGVKATVAATANGLLTVIIGWATAWRLARIVGKPFGYSLDLMKEKG